MRKPFLDNIRWATVLLVIVYHVFYLYNAQGIFGGIGPFQEEQPWEIFCTVVYPWFMVLLYVVAGTSARYALEKYGPRQFMKSKARRLLVPSTLGLTLLPALQGYLYIRLGGSADMIPGFLIYPISMVSGIGPLWFLHLLFIFSWILSRLVRCAWWEKLYALGEKASLPLLLGLALPVWGAAQVLNMPVITTYRFGIYFLSFLLGYLVFSHEAVQQRLKKYCIPLLAGTVVCGAVYVWRFRGQVYSGDPVLRHGLTNLYLWLAVLAIFGCGKAWWDRTGKIPKYLAKSSFGIYIVHYFVTLSLCVGLRETGLPVPVIYALAIVLSILVSIGVHEILRRIPLVRYVIFGYRKEEANVPR